MTRIRTTASIRRLQVLALAALLAPCVVTRVDARQAWYQLYDQAIDHVNKREWQEAETKLLAAQKGAQQAGRGAGPQVLRYGTIRGPFFPSYYLGVVYLNTGRPAQAAKLFEQARAEGVDKVRGFTQFTQLLAQAQAQAQSAGAKPPVVANNNTTPPPVTNPPTNTATNPPAGDKPATTEKPAPPTQSNTNAAPPPITAPPVDTRAQQLERDRNAAAQEVTRALTARDLSAALAAQSKLVAIDKAWATTGDLQIRINALRASIAAERRAMLAFFGGNYQETLQVLRQLEGSGALSPRGYFYRACSLAAIAMRENPRDAKGLDEARKQYARVTSGAMASLARDRQYVSPEILRVLTGI
jgi:tetratricopeptide (TPR) repeat protein